MTDKRGPTDEKPPASPAPEVAQVKAGVPPLSFGDDENTAIDEHLDEAFSIDPFFSDGSVASSSGGFDESVVPQATAVVESGENQRFVLPPINFDDIVINESPSRDDRHIEEPTMLVSRDMLFGGDDDVHTSETRPSDVAPGGSPPKPDPNMPRYQAPRGVQFQEPPVVVRRATLEPRPREEKKPLRSELPPEEPRVEAASTMPIDTNALIEWEDEDKHWVEPEGQQGGQWDRMETNQREMPASELAPPNDLTPPPQFIDVDAALAALEQDYEVDEVKVPDPYEVTGLIVIEEKGAKRVWGAAEEPTGQIEYRMKGIDGEGDLPIPWTRFVGEMRRELVANREADKRAAYLHEVADVLRMAGDRWLSQAQALDALSLDLAPTYLPALRARLVDALAFEGRESYREALSEIMEVLGRARAPQGEALKLLGALHTEDAVVSERHGDHARAQKAYAQAQLAEGGAFFSLNAWRQHLAQGDMEGARSAMMSLVADHAGTGPGNEGLRALWLVDAAEMFRRSKDNVKAAELVRKALDYDPTSLAAYRILQLIAWQSDSLDLEVEGLTGQLAIMVESGRKLARNDARLRLMKRKAAARFFRLGQLLSKLDRHEEAVKALKDALGIRRHELLYLRALERASRSTGDWHQVARTLTRQLGLIVDPVLQALLLVEQAHVFTLSGDMKAAREHLERSLEVAPDCLPARISLGRLLLKEGQWESLIALRSEGADEAPDPNLDHALRRAQDAWRRGELREFCLGDLPTAADEYMLACRWLPGRGPWVRAAERLLFRMGRWTELTTLYRGVIDHAPSPAARPMAQLKAVRLAEQRGDWESAIADMLALLEDDQAPMERLEELGYFYRRHGWDKAAVDVLEQVAQMSLEALQTHAPDSDEAREARWRATRATRWLAELREKSLEDSDAAMEAHRLILSLRPGDASALQRFREVLVRRGDWGRLVELLQTQARETESDEVKRDLLLEASDICMRRLRDRDRALEMLGGLVERLPDDTSVLDALEEALRERRDWSALATLLLTRARRHGANDTQQGARQAVEAALLRRDRLRDDAGALEAFSLALDIAPGLSIAHRGAVGLLSQTGDHSALMDHMTRWRRRATTDEAWIGLTLEQAWVLEFEMDEPEDALDLHDGILERDPACIQSLWAKVRLHARLDQPEGLIEALRRMSARVVDRQDKIALLMRAGRIAERLGQGVEVHYRRVLELDLTHEGARRGLERCLKARNEYGELLGIYLERAKATGGAQRVHYLIRIAGVYEEMGRDEDACEILRKVLILEPGYEMARLSLARLARKVDDWETAAAMEEQLIEGAPSQAIRLVHLSEAASIYQHRLGDRGRAEPILKKIIDLDPNSEGAYETLRSLYGAPENDAQLDALLEVIEARLDVEEGNPRMALLREGVALAIEKRPEIARAWLKLLLEINPGDSNALLQAAGLAEAKGQSDESVELLKQWLEVDRARGGLGEPSDEDRAQRQGILLRLSSLLVENIRDVRAAEPFLEELLSNPSPSPRASALMARAQIRLGHPERACDMYKNLFEVQPSATLALQIAWLLDENMRRQQEALAWYMRAQDLDPLSADAMKGFYSVMRRLGEKAPSTLHVRVLRDRLDWLAEGFRQGIDEDPWQLDHFRQLARIHVLQDDMAALRPVAGVLVYFDLVEEEAVRRCFDEQPSGKPALLLHGQGGSLSEEEVRERVLLPEARGLRRRVLSLVWESLAAVDPDDLRRRGLSRSDRLTERDGDRRHTVISNLARSLQIFGVDVYPHPNDPFAVHGLFTPEPALVVGSGIFEKPHDPFHHFRVTRALEALRDGKGLMARRDAPQMLAAVDEVIESLFGNLPAVPVYDVPPSEGWLSDGKKRLFREVKRRVRRDLRSALDTGAAETSKGNADDWMMACTRSPLRIGLAVCGEFGAAVDAVAGTSFSLDAGGGGLGRRELMLARLRDGQYNADIAALLRFIVSEDFQVLRQRLEIVPARSGS